MTTTVGAGIRRRRGLRALGAAFVAALAVAPAASAHGDPASHYLETDALYPSYARQPSQARQLELLGLLEAAARRGYPIKVALVAGGEDLVDSLGMLKLPQNYAESVTRMIERRLEAPVLIVTPHGVGVSGRAFVDGRLRALTTGESQRLVRGIVVPPDATGDQLARTAMAAVRQIARAGGRRLPADVPPAKSFVPPAGASTAPATQTTADPDRGSGALLLATPVLLVALALAGGLAYHHRRRPPPTVRAEA